MAMAQRENVNSQDNSTDLASFIKEKGINLSSRKEPLSDDDIKNIAEKFSMDEILGHAKHIAKEKLAKIIEKKNAIDKENRAKLEEQDKELKALGEEKKTDEARKSKDIAALRALLDFDEKSNENDKEEMDYLIESIAINSKNRDILDRIKATKEKLDKDPKPEGKEKEELEQQQKAEKEELHKIIMDRNFAYFKNFSEQYNGTLKQLETKRIVKEGFKSQDGLLSVPQLKFRQNLHTRYRINRTIAELNAIGNDPKKGVKFVLSKTFRSHGGRITGGFKQLSARLRIRDTKKFDEIYNKQKQYFVDDLEAKMNKNSMSTKDKEAIAAIKKRLDFYQAAYKRQFITV